VTPVEIVSTIRLLGLDVRLAPAGVVTVHPKSKLPPELRLALTEQMSGVIALLEAERAPAPRAAGDMRPTLYGKVGDLKEDAAAAWRIIAHENQPPRLFHGSGLQWIERDDEGRPFAQLLDAPRLTHYLAQEIYFYVKRRHGDADVEQPVPPPAELVRDLLATPEPPVPVLRRIVATPFVTAAGTVHATPGYDPTSRAYFLPPEGFALPAVSPNPTPEEIQAARELILEPFRDFPFLEPADRAHTAAALLSVFVRELIDGPCPLILFSKPAPGTGASLCASVIALIATGTPPAAMTEAQDPDEWRKKITTALMNAPAVIFLDNLTRVLDSAHLAAALTLGTWKDRLLGRHELLRLPIRAVWLGTGNNVTLTTDLNRRTVRVRMDARMERPWLRAEGGFSHPNLEEWVRAERPRIVHACLTLAMAWVARGLPHGAVTIGGYEAWSRVLGGLLEVAEIPGFLANTQVRYEEADVEAADEKTFVAKWWADLGSAPKGLGELLAIAAHEDVALPLSGKDDQARRVSLGHRLRRMSGRHYELGPRLTVTVARAGEAAHRVLWRLIHTTFGAGPSSARPGAGPEGTGGDRGGFSPSSGPRSGVSVENEVEECRDGSKAEGEIPSDPVLSPPVLEPETPGGISVKIPPEPPLSTQLLTGGGHRRSGDGDVSVTECQKCGESFQRAAMFSSGVGQALCVLCAGRSKPLKGSRLGLERSAAVRKALEDNTEAARTEPASRRRT
jgi:hypothetical protein